MGAATGRRALVLAATTKARRTAQALGTAPVLPTARGMRQLAGRKRREGKRSLSRTRAKAVEHAVKPRSRGSFTLGDETKSVIRVHQTPRATLPENRARAPATLAWVPPTIVI